MKEIKVRFRNCWDDSNDCDKYEVVIFRMQKEMAIDFQEETDILDNCHTILNYYDCEDEEDLLRAFEEYDNVTHSDLDIAKKILDDGNYGVIASRIADFVASKYPNVTWELPNCSYDLEVNID